MGPGTFVTVPDWALNWPLTQKCIGSMEDHTYIQYIKTQQNSLEGFSQQLLFFVALQNISFPFIFFLLFGHLCCVKKTQTRLFRCTWKYLQCMVFNSVLFCSKCFIKLISLFWYLGKTFTTSLQKLNWCFFLMLLFQSHQYFRTWMSHSPGSYHQWTMYTTHLFLSHTQKNTLGF